MATKVGGFPSNSQSHLENISATGSQIPPNFRNNCRFFFFWFCFRLLTPPPPLLSELFSLPSWVSGWLDGGAEGEGPPLQLQ